MGRTYIKRNLSAIAGGDYAVAAVMQAAVPVIDCMADKGIIHKKKAVRHKSCLNAQVKSFALNQLKHVKKAQQGFFIVYVFVSTVLL